MLSYLVRGGAVLEWVRNTLPRWTEIYPGDCGVWKEGVAEYGSATFKCSMQHLGGRQRQAGLFASEVSQGYLVRPGL